jgi:hypothetical protein
MAEPIVRTFVIDTTKAEQNLQSLDVATTQTTVALDALYNQLFELDELLNKLSPNSEAFNDVNVQIKALESSITKIESGKFQELATDISAVGTAVEGVDTSNVESLTGALTGIDTNALQEASDDITAISIAVDSVDSSQLSALDTALSSIDGGNLTTVSEDIATITASVDGIDSTNLEQLQSSVDSLGSGDLNTVANDIESINTSVNSLDSSNLNQLQLDFESIDTTQVVTNIEAVNEAASAIDISNIATDIDGINSALSSIDTTQAVTSIGEIEASLNDIDATNAIGNIQNIDSALDGIDTANVVTDIENINSALSSIDASSAVAEVSSVNTTLDAIDTSNVTGQIENINNDLASVDVSTAINEIASINEEFSKIDTQPLITAILGIGDSVNQIDTSAVVEQIGAINTELNSIDATNVTADVSEISTAIESIDASNAVTEISSIDTALSGIDTGQIVGDINNIGEAVSNINTDNITDVGNAVNNASAPVENLATSTAKLNDELKDTKVDSSSISNATANFKEFGDEQDAVTTSTKSLKAQLRELQKQLAETDPQTEKYRELSQTAGELKDKIQDAAQAVGSQAGGAFERVGGSLGLVTSRIASLDFEGAAEGAKLLAQNIGSIKPGDITNGIKGIGSAFASIGKALLTNPIFLIGAAIAGAIVYAEELLSLVDGVSGAEEERLSAQKESAAYSKEQLDAIGQQENLLKLQGKSEKEILQLKIAAAKQALIDQKAVIDTLKIQRQQQIDAAKRNADITKGILQFLTAPLQLLLGAVDGIIFGLNKVGVISNETYASIGSLRESLNESVTSLIFDPAEIAAEGDKAIAEAEKVYKNLENTQAGFQLSVNQINQKAADDRQKTRDEELAAEKKLAQDILNVRNKNAQELATITNKIRKDSAKPVEVTAKKVGNVGLTLTPEEEQAIKDKILKEQSIERNAEETRISFMAEGVDKEIALVDLKYAKMRDAAQGNAELIKKIAQANADEVNAIEEKEAQNRKAREFAVQDAKLQATSDALGAINGLVGAFAKKDEKSAKRAFKAQKAISIAQATVDTYKSANAIFYAAAANPATVLFPAQPFIAAGVAIASGLANVATIAKQEFQSSAPAGGNENVPSLPGDGGGTASQPAQFNPLAASFLENRPEQTTPRAYVLAGDVANQQEVRQKVEDLSRIG